jgi:hypothetical protein
MWKKAWAFFPCLCNLIFTGIWFVFLLVIIKRAANMGKILVPTKIFLISDQFKISSGGGGINCK